MTSRRQNLDRLKTPAYSIAEAARIVGVPVTTLRYWVRGRDRNKPVIRAADSAGGYLSFLGLVEAHVLAALRRRYKVPFSAIRRAVDKLRKRYRSEHPLADREFKTDGKHLLIEELGSLINLSQEEQFELRELIDVYLKRVERDRQTGLPVRLFPVFRADEQTAGRSVVVDPAIGFGRPILTTGKIPTEVIADRFRAGDDIEELARDFDVDPGAIQEAIRYETRTRAA